MTALAAFTGSAAAADLPARTYTKAAPVAVAPSWTGFYVFGGAGGGVWDADTFARVTGAGTALDINQRQGGDGWFAPLAPATTGSSTPAGSRACLSTVSLAA